ncbi:MAG: response regulator transcription factor [Ekhidna sp.]|uniref:response regulator transcription factor n=1 Tax=Ekhidna sp. TaxID=2608089 RepID=UPI0032ED66DF
MTNPPKILLAEDEAALGMIIRESLESRGFEVVFCANGEEARQAYEKDRPDIMVLDVMMPKLDGFSLVKELRKRDQYVPIIFLTAKSRTEDVVEGFGYGANDYLKKPFSMEELIVRIHALLNRKISKSGGGAQEVGDYSFDCQKQVLTHKPTKQEERLTHREAQLLDALVRNVNELTDRQVILKTLWGNDDFFNARSMDVFISKLRKKLAQDTSIQIVNVRGYGYKLVVG